MKILGSASINKNSLVRYSGTSPEDGYAVESPQGTITVIDRNGDIADILYRTTLIYTIDEAQKLIDDMHRIWPDYKEDLYYKQGYITYPLRSSKAKNTVLQEHLWKDGIILYRCKLAGEYIYGVCHGDKYIEAPMDGWEEWLSDRKRIIENRNRAIYCQDLGWEFS